MRVGSSSSPSATPTPPSGAPTAAATFEGGWKLGQAATALGSLPFTLLSLGEMTTGAGRIAAPPAGYREAGRRGLLGRGALARCGFGSRLAPLAYAACPAGPVSRSASDLSTELRVSLLGRFGLAAGVERVALAPASQRLLA